MIMSLLLFENEFLNIVAISFTALVFNELIMVALEITTWCASRLVAVHLEDLLRRQAYLYGDRGDRHIILLCDFYGILTRILRYACSTCCIGSAVTHA